MRSVSRVLAGILALGLFTTVAESASAQGFPSKPVRIVVPFPAGGPTDTFGRIVAHGLTETLGQQVIVDNRAGASGIIGTEVVAKAAPDGYTLLVQATPHVINPALYKKLPYNTERDFTPLALIATTPNILVVHASFPANSVAELIAMAKAKPGSINFASSTVGGSNHLSAELFNSMAGIKMEHVSYKGAAPAMNDLLAGHVPVMFNTIGAMVPHVKSGKLKALGVSGVKRTSVLPDVPAIAETLPGYEAVSWFAIWGPAGMSKELVTRLNTEVLKVLRSAEVRKRFAGLDAEPGSSSAEEFAAFQKSEMAKWAKVVKDIGLQLD